MKILGFDPGGGTHFGCALFDTESLKVDVFLAASVDDAIAWSIDKLDGYAPSIAGIDTLLFWQSTKSGWRGADVYLRRRYPASRNSVLCSNGLYGSMAVQGAVLAFRLRSVWADIRLTETHPKILWSHLFPDDLYPRGWIAHEKAYQWVNSIGFEALPLSSEDEFDAILSAWAALQVVQGKWTLDLVKIPAPDQVSENVFLVPNINYYWPDDT